VEGVGGWGEGRTGGWEEETGEGPAGRGGEGTGSCECVAVHRSPVWYPAVVLCRAREGSEGREGERQLVVAAVFRSSRAVPRWSIHASFSTLISKDRQLEGQSALPPARLVTHSYSRVIFELFADVVPKTCEKYASYALGLHYKLTRDGTVSDSFVRAQRESRRLGIHSTTSRLSFTASWPTSWSREVISSRGMAREVRVSMGGFSMTRT
jgi:hypothetical protein